jgi:hypothetical protein
MTENIDVICKKTLVTLSCNLFGLQQINIHDMHKAPAEINLPCNKRQKKIWVVPPTKWRSLRQTLGFSLAFAPSLEDRSRKFRSVLLALGAMLGRTWSSLRAWLPRRSYIWQMKNKTGMKYWKIWEIISDKSPWLPLLFKIVRECHLRLDAVWLLSEPTFRRNVSPPSSECEEPAT